MCHPLNELRSCLSFQQVWWDHSVRVFFDDGADHKSPTAQTGLFLQPSCWLPFWPVAALLDIFLLLCRRQTLMHSRIAGYEIRCDVLQKERLLCPPSLFFGITFQSGRVMGLSKEESCFGEFVVL